MQAPYQLGPGSAREPLHDGKGQGDEAHGAPLCPCHSQSWPFPEPLPCGALRQPGPSAAFCQLCLFLETEIPQLPNHDRRRCFT